MFSVQGAHAVRPYAARLIRSHFTVKPTAHRRVTVQVGFTCKLSYE